MFQILRETVKFAAFVACLFIAGGPQPSGAAPIIEHEFIAVLQDLTLGGTIDRTVKYGEDLRLPETPGPSPALDWGIPWGFFALYGLVTSVRAEAGNNFVLDVSTLTTAGDHACFSSEMICTASDFQQKSLPKAICFSRAFYQSYFLWWYEC